MRRRVIAALRRINSHPAAGFLTPPDLELVAADILDCWLTEPGRYPGGLAGFVADYVTDVEDGARPGQLAAAWKAHLETLR